MDKRKIWESIPEEAKSTIVRGIKEDMNISINLHQNIADKLLGRKRPSDSELEIIFKTESLLLGGSEISSIDFVQHFENIKSILIWGTKVTDISPLSSLKKLENIYASGTKIRSYEPLRNSRLKLLYNSYSGASDYQYLSNITTLEKLELSDNDQLNSVEWFYHLSNLEMLHIAHTRVTSLRPIIGLTKLQELLIVMTPIPQNEIAFFDSKNKSSIKAQNWL
jgi:internalin A